MSVNIWGTSIPVEATARPEDLSLNCAWWRPVCEGEGSSGTCHWGGDRTGLQRIFSAMVKILEFYCERNHWKTERKEMT